ncbi:Putative uncharacterized transketolase family protein y4mN [Pseudomonas sp. 9AZ]|uniref:transketolase family protein n=1 Tax=Pseudomonas sp. 9AZ TaxID=2653168 RepID=UPI0012EEE616|nr:transketolase C-terminal domain-containing protein [Pseudomonas sp. 9AZ]VXD04475.1 Putative uncharacterized transketolase family protein y4mN [Pseudomonas sp. 9AZ]
MSRESITGAAAQMGMRAEPGTFGRVLLQAAQQRPEVVALTADLAKYTDLQAFAETYPTRFLNVGMAEQNLVMVAAGMARSGLVPVATTFAAFMTRRAQDFTIMQVALPRANVKLIGAVPGVMPTFGPSHTSIDDLAMMRAVPNMVVIDPCDMRDLKEATAAALAYDGPVYLRQPFFNAQSAAVTSEREAFQIGKNTLLCAGGDVGIIASSFMVGEALQAAQQLAQQGIQASVLKVSSLKPFDTRSVLELAARVPRLITAENHSVIGGLFSTVAETLAREGLAVRVEAVGVQDVFPMFGSREYVAGQLNMTSGEIVKRALSLCRI